ncbi:hypothetical protein DPEC_G00183690 [Dallia pectoralis]|uniref:Uncharacterized protein n=1 Tax=Dallia pectoralis TaxID=75939 RepID=A0ACC2GAY6_DALPE|nr:hypothetical protein DPEC_G00183690 [Dallia pectoralis]
MEPENDWSSRKEGEDTREVVIGILTRVVPMSVDRLRETVDTVHRVGRKGNAATSNNTPIIIQFGMRTVRDDVWKRSRDASMHRDALTLQGRFLQRRPRGSY